jgi:hypothetical protein
MFSTMTVEQLMMINEAHFTFSNSVFCIYGFRTILTVNSNYLLKTALTTDLHNGKKCDFYLRQGLNS